MFAITLISVVVTAGCLIWKIPLLRLIFGQVEDAVMEASQTYFFYTALSFPFIALFDAGSSVFRAQKNTRLPMTVSVISNILNVAGNGILIWVFDMGVAGAAISTLGSRYFFRHCCNGCFKGQKKYDLCARLPVYPAAVAADPDDSCGWDTIRY